MRGATVPSPRVIDDWPPGVAGVVEYRCYKNHVHLESIPDMPESTGRFRGLRFGDATCPFCEADRTGWIPPSKIWALWWELPADALRLDALPHRET